ncbi:MAG: hypothetical protein NUV67_02225 [archaeon]|nr:hypothetical protein [archaeon]
MTSAIAALYAEKILDLEKLHDLTQELAELGFYEVQLARSSKLLEKSRVDALLELEYANRGNDAISEIKRLSRLFDSRHNMHTKIRNKALRISRSLKKA